ncbi:MAG: hypothetical protein JST30_07980 [Armatimonadetes bacterium]|nr:hypothetical protein [Armatimonadota bacterium]
MRLRAMALAAGLLAVFPSAWGQALLKLQGSQFAPIRQKSLDLRATLNGPVATTVLNMTYFNPAHAQTEADFVFTVPEGSVVIGFAYWYKRERVVARIVDKERAAQIYSAIKTVRRDPALVELIGKRTFRARIFPVEQRSDLKIEMTVVCTARDGSFTLPVKVAKDQPIESAVVTVEGAAPAGVTQIVNNYGAPSTFENGRYRLRIEGKQWRPDKDLKVGLQSRNSAVKVMSSGSSGTGAGYFALLVSSGSAISRPQVALSGVRTSGIHVERRANLQAGQTLLVTGRAQGPGKLNVRLTGQKFKGDAAVSLEFRGEKAALSKLWAQDEIERLGKAKANEARVRALSKRYLLPSPYTSWLAIPESERKRFELDIRAANAVIEANRLSATLQKGASYRAVRARLMARISKEPKDVQDQAVGVLQEAAYRIMDGETEKISTAWSKRVAAGASPGLRERGELRRLMALARSMDIGRGQLWLDADSEVRTQVTKLEGHIGKGAIDESAARKEAERLKAWFQLGDRNGSWNHVVTWATQQGATEYEQEVLGQGRETDRALTLKAHVLRATDWMSGDVRTAFGPYVLYDAQEIAKTLAIAQLDGQSGSEHVQAVQRRLDGFDQVFGWFDAPSSVKQQVKQVARARMFEAIPDLGRAVRKSGFQDEGVQAKLRSAERYRELSESTVYVGDAEHYLWSQPAEEIVDEARSRLLGGESVESVRADLERQRKRIEEAKFRSMLKEVDDRLLRQLDEEAMAISGQRWRPDPDDAMIAEHERAIRAFAALLQRDPDETLKRAQEDNYWGEDARWKFLMELRNPEPDPDRVSKLREDFRDANPDWRGQEWIGWRIERIETEALIDKLEKRELTPELEKQIAELRKKAEELHARMGDPVLSVGLPPATVRAFARFPWNHDQELTFNAQSGRWEAKFDVPLFATAGLQTVHVIGIDRNGKTSSTDWTFQVDLSAPVVSAKAVWTDGKLRITVEGTQDLARVKVVVPWGAPVPLLLVRPGLYATVLETPPGWWGKVTVVAFDKAHNRVETVADVPPRP